MAELLKTEISRKELEEGKIDANFVLCEMFYSAEGQATQSGIIYGINPELTYQTKDDPDDKSSHVADLAETCALVTKLPESLYFNPEDPQSMPWDCDMDLEVGDLIFTNPIETLNAVSLVCEGKIYKLLPYSDLYCAKRRRKSPYNAEEVLNLYHQTGMLLQDITPEIVIMLNGYVLCSQVNRPKLSELDVTNCDIIDKTRGLVAYLGKPNRRHRIEHHTDFIDLKIGDEILFDKRYSPFLLERQLYSARFSKEKLYWVIPRSRIVAVVNRK